MRMNRLNVQFLSESGDVINTIIGLNTLPNSGDLFNNFGKMYKVVYRVLKVEDSTKDEDAISIDWSVVVEPMP